MQIICFIFLIVNIKILELYLLVTGDEVDYQKVSYSITMLSDPMTKPSSSV